MLSNSLADTYALEAGLDMGVRQAVLCGCLFVLVRVRVRVLVLVLVPINISRPLL